MKKLFLIAFLATLTQSATNMFAMENNNQEDNQSKKLRQLSLASQKGLFLRIPEQICLDTIEAMNVKKMFEKYHVSLASYQEIIEQKITEKKWLVEPIFFIEKMDQIESLGESEVAIYDIPELLTYAKSLIKSFLLGDEELTTIDKNSLCKYDIGNNSFYEEEQVERYIKKEGLNRLFTYANIKNVLQKKSLSHIHLPRKMLALKNMKTNNYISFTKAQEIIDEILVFEVRSFGKFGIVIINICELSEKTDTYEFGEVNNEMQHLIISY